MLHYLLHLMRAGDDQPDTVSISVGREVRARELALELLGREPGGLWVKAWRDGVLAFELSASAASAEPSDERKAIAYELDGETV